VDDPYGLRFGASVGMRLARLSDRRRTRVARALLATRLRRIILWLQLRTRVIDDVLAGFVKSGGRQVLILGAGFDCRASRFAESLGDATVFEVDHPATQQRKVAVLREAEVVPANVRYVAWDFERNPMHDLPRRLAASGHDPHAPTLTIWEGVIMYLTRKAMEDTLEALSALGSPGSMLVFNYTERGTLAFFRRLAVLVGEPVRSTWSPEEVAAMLASHGFSMQWDRRDDDLARELFSPAWAARFSSAGGRIGLARPSR